MAATEKLLNYFKRFSSKRKIMIISLGTQIISLLIMYLICHELLLLFLYEKKRGMIFTEHEISKKIYLFIYYQSEKVKGEDFIIFSFI
jgi:hypothetical protein